MTQNQSNRSSPNRLTPRIYVASLADYTAGRLHGRWIDAAQPIEGIRSEVSEMLAESKEPIAEEWAIHDYEGFDGLSLSEYEDLALVAEVARLTQEHGPVFPPLVSYLGGVEHVEIAKEYMASCYHGIYESLADYAEAFVEDCYSEFINGLPDFIRYHIDYQGMGDDMETGGNIFTLEVDGKLHIFDAYP